MSHTVLVTGGTRSGKSRFAESRLQQLAPEPPWLYLATCQPFDDELRERVRIHRAGRPIGWRTAEAPFDPTAALCTASEPTPIRGALVECVTLWLSNLLHRGDHDAAILAAAEALGAAARQTAAPVVLVTNELGSGIVPETALGRRFRDLAGAVNQQLAAQADEVVFVACGLPLRLR